MRLLRRLVLVWLIGGFTAAGAAGPGTTVFLSADIAPRPLTEALATFGRETGLQLIYVSAIAETQHSKGARAGLTASAALTQLLDGTGLTFEYLNARTVRIFPASVEPSAASRAPRPRQAAERNAFALEAVIVTATRREEAVNRVPIDMVVWTQEAMQASGVKGMSELAFLTPEVQFQPSAGTSGANTYLVMRGVLGRYASTTGLYLDDTPIPPVWGDFVLHSFPFAFDLDRVEVLRGPQLQLFGEGNEGGAVRFISQQPSLSAFSALATGEVATTSFGAPSHEAGVAFGGPVIRDVLGFRVSAWTRSDGGYVDRVDPFTAAVVDRNANHSVSTSLRGALTIAPSEALQLTPSLTYINYHRHDSPYFYTDLSDVGAGQIRNANLLRQPADEAFYLGALKLTATLHAARVSAVSSYFDRSVDFVVDDTDAFEWSSSLGAGYPINYADAVADQWHLQQRMFMQELRLTSSDPGAALTWDAAAFYSNYRVRSAEHLTGANGFPGEAPAPVNLEQAAVGAQTRFAAFGQVSLRVTKQLTASVGVHGEHTHYDAANEPAPPLSAAGTDSGLMPRFSLAYQADEQELFYLTVGQGYGSSGPLPPGLICNQASPMVFSMDTLWSYEVGTKSTLLGGRMRLDTGIFHIIWNNSGYHLGSAADPTPCGLPGGPGAAASNGFDLATRILLGAHVKLDMDIAYTDARYTRTIAQDGVVFLRSGQAVNTQFDFASVSPWNLTAAVDYLAALGPDATVELRAEHIFRSQNPGPFALQDPQSPFYNPGYRPDPATRLLNLRASARWQQYDAALFVTNAFNALPTIQRTNSTGVPTERFDAATFRPRTVGLTVSWRF